MANQKGGETFNRTAFGINKKEEPLPDPLFGTVWFCISEFYSQSEYDFIVAHLIFYRIITRIDKVIIGPGAQAV